MSTKAELRLEARHYINELGGEYEPDSSETQYDLDDALNKGYMRYAKETRCFPAAYKYTPPTNNLAGTALFSHVMGLPRLLGSDYNAVAVLAAANNTTALTIAGQPDVNARNVVVAITNVDGATVKNNASNFVIVGTYGGSAATETLAFTASAANMATGTVVYLVGTTLFDTITSITPSAAQPTGFWHVAGFGALGMPYYSYSLFGSNQAGERIFALEHVSYNEIMLQKATAEKMDGMLNRWRFTSNGTPTHWIPWGEGRFRLWRPPTVATPIYVEGYETPDLSRFSSDFAEDRSDTPLIHEDDHSLIAMWAAILMTIRDPNSENAARQSMLFPIVQQGWKAAYRRIHNSGSENIVFGRGPGGADMTGMARSQDVANI